VEVKRVRNRNPVEFTGKVLDQRNDLTTPAEDSASFPQRPKHVMIQSSKKISKWSVLIEPYFL